MMMLKKQRKCAAFTLVELLVALMVAAIVLTAAATMADAMACGKEACDQMSRNAAYLLQIQTRLSDLIMRANEITNCVSDNLVLWHDDNRDGVQAADGSEYTTIEADGTGKVITITEDGIVTNYMYQWKDQNGQYQNAQSNVLFDYDDDKLVTVKFDLTENGVAQTYQVCAALRGKTD